MKTEPATDLFADADIISTYTRAEAIEDGILVDLSSWSGPDQIIDGWPMPVAVTRAVWSMVEAIPKSKSFQDVRGRAHDLLWMGLFAMRGYTKRHGGIPYGLGICYRFIMHHGRRKYVTLKMVLSGEGPDGGPCVTIMLPEED